MGFMTRKNLARRVAKTAPRQTVRKEKEVKAEVKTEAGYTREEVNSMPFFKVKSIAQANGIDVADKKTAELRSEVIEKLGL